MIDVASLSMCMLRKPFKLSRSCVLLCLPPTHFCHMECYPQLWWSVLQQRESHSILYLHIPPLDVSQGTPKEHMLFTGTEGEKSPTLQHFLQHLCATSCWSTRNTMVGGAGPALLSWGENSHQPAAFPRKLPGLRSGCSWSLQLGWMQQELEGNRMGWLLSFRTKLSGSQRESFRIRAFSLSQAREEMLSRVCWLQALSSLFSHIPQPPA